MERKGRDYMDDGNDVTFDWLLLWTHFIWELWEEKKKKLWSIVSFVESPRLTSKSLHNYMQRQSPRGHGEPTPTLVPSPFVSKVP
jgi:hypothetical protein